MTTFFSYILTGTSVTLSVTALALPLGLILGLGLALLSVYGGGLLSSFANTYSTILRGVPPIVLLFILYFMVSGAINLSPFLAGSISLGIISSAYQQEILRGAIQSVGGGQMMAARAIGMSRPRAIRHIVLPQALRLAIPAWSNEAAIVIKDSSLVYVLSVKEILQRAEEMSASTHQPFLAYGAAALIYLVLIFITNRLLDFLQQRTRIPAMAV